MPTRKKSEKNDDKSDDKKDRRARGASPMNDLLWEALETEIGGVEVYLNALQCAVNPELREEWEEYLAETRQHVDTLEAVLKSLGLDPDRDTPGRQVVRLIGKSLVKAMQLALGSLPAAAAEVVAAECVVHAETKDHANWELIGKLLEEGVAKSEELTAAHAQIEDEEDEHLYHTQGWCRELHRQLLGLTATLPPPEEVEDVHTAAEAAAASKSPARARK